MRQPTDLTMTKERESGYRIEKNRTSRRGQLILQHMCRQDIATLKEKVS